MRAFDRDYQAEEFMAIFKAKRRIPAEWESHRTIFMAPGSEKADDDTTPATFSRHYLALSKAVSNCGAVTYLASKQVAKGIAAADNNTFLPIQHYDVWARDSIFIPLVTNEGLRALIPRYSNYGNHPRASRKPAAQVDGKVATALANALGIPVVTSELAFEGGAIDSDGEGTILTTESCLLDENRNASRDGETRAQKKVRVEAALKEATGATNIVWIPGSSCSEDVTRGHVDGIARFVAPGVVVLHEPHAVEGRAWVDFEANRAALENAVDAQGRPITVVSIRGPQHRSDWSPGFCDSYVNFLFVNGGLIIPEFGDARDEEARAKLQALLPDKTMISVRVDGICALGGGIHCVTASLPHMPLSLDDIRSKLFEAEEFRKLLAENYDLQPTHSYEEQVLKEFARVGQSAKPWRPDDVTNRHVLRAAALAIGSNSRDWATFSKEKEQFLAFVHDGEDDAFVRKEIAAHLTGVTGPADIAAIIAWREMLRRMPEFAKLVLDPIVVRYQEVGNLSEIERTALMSLEFASTIHSPGMGFALSSEFLRNLGRPGFKPDRHIMRLLKLWQPGYLAAVARAKELLRNYIGREDSDAVQQLAACILGDRFTEGWADKIAADQIIWLYGALTRRNPKARIIPVGQRGTSHG
jgi:agmatine deiminase